MTTKTMKNPHDPPLRSSSRSNSRNNTIHVVVPPRRRRWIRVPVWTIGMCRHVDLTATARDLRANIAPRNHTAATASTSSTDTTNTTTTTTTNNTNTILRRGIGFSSYRLITHPRPAGGYVVDGREGDYAISRGLGRFSVQSNVAGVLLHNTQLYPTDHRVESTTMMSHENLETNTM